MKRFKSSKQKSALVALLTMLIFLFSVSGSIRMTVYAKEDIVIVFEDDEDIEDDDDEDDDEDDDDEDDGDENDDEDVEVIDDDEGSGKTGGSDNSSKKDDSTGKTSNDNRTELVDSTKKSTIIKSIAIKEKKKTQIFVDLSKKSRSYHEKLEKGDKLKIAVRIKGRKVKNKKLIFSSSKKNVASVSEKGVISVKKSGTTRIKIVNRANRKEKCTIVITVPRNRA